MMGEQRQGGRGASVRTLGAALPRDHLLRRIDRVLDMGELRDALACHYSARGRPSIDPELLIRMALIGRIYAIPSERRLCEEVRYNLAYRWFCRLPLGAAVPHHSTFSKNRHGRFRSADVFRLLFENTVRRCVAAGLVGAKDAAIDASFIAADASWQRKLRDGDLDRAAMSRPLREWLADEAHKLPDSGPRRGTPAELSRTDPAAAWSARTARGRFGYAFNLLMDAPSGAAVGVAATPARHASEVDAGRDMLARAAERFGYRPKRVTADTAYGSAAFLAFVHEHGATPHIPVLDRTEQTKGKLSRGAFTFDRDHDRYICPTGKPLAHRSFRKRIGMHVYQAKPEDCCLCPIQKRCTDSRHRIVLRMADEDTRDLVRAEMATGLYQRSMRLRRGIERLFADAKARRGMARLRLRGLRGAEEEFLIGAAVLNLLLLARPPHQRTRKGRTDVVPLPPSVTRRTRLPAATPARHAAVSLNS